MKNTIVLNLLPSTLDRDAILDTFHQFNSAKNDVSEVAYRDKCFNKHKLGEQLYHALRQKYTLPSQLVISCIGTVVKDYQSHPRGTMITYELEDSILYDKRVISFRGLTSARLSTTIGRLDVPFTVIGYKDWGKNPPKQKGMSLLFHSLELLTFIG